MSDLYGSPMIIRSVLGNDLLRVNREFVDEIGLDAPELGSKDLVEWLHSDDREAVAAQLEAGEGSARGRHVTRSGEWVDFLWAIRSHDGELVARGTPVAVPAEGAATVGDVQRRAGATMNETLDAMARVVESKNPGMLCSILLVDQDRKYIVGGAGPSLPPDYNRAVEGLLLGPAVGSCGSAAFWNAPVVVENIAEDFLWRDLRDAADIAGVSACWSHPVTTVDGQILGAMALYSRVPSTPTRHQMEGLEVAARMVGLAIERDRLEEQLRLTMKVEAIGVLAGGIAHDFNNMLGAVLGNAELALSTLDDPVQLKARLNEIITASLGASELCKQLLAYAGRGALTTESVECNDLVREIGGLMQVTLSKKASMSYDLDDAELGLRADRGQLHRVIMNLMTNAAEAVGDAEGQIVIGTRARHLSQAEIETEAPDSDLEPGDYVQLWVSDTGAGMSTAVQARIFDPFFTRKATGRGLGLSAVQGIVRGHGGAITVRSKEGEGTTFSVLLPLVPLDRPAAAAPDGTGNGNAGGRVLLVDDDDHVRTVLSEMLRMAGYEVTLAVDGADAVELFRANPDDIDCVLMDLSMPRMGGEEAFNELRTIRADVPVVLSSGFTEQEMMDRFKDTGLTGFLHKPARMAILLAKIAAALEGARDRVER